MKIACPFCSTHLDVHPSQGGLETNCPDCDGLFKIPVITAAPPGGSSYGNNPYRNPQGQGSYQQPDAVRDFANKKIAAGICGILLGGLGVHKFILGFSSAGAVMLSIYVLCMFGACIIGVPVLGCMAMQVIGLVEGIIYLTKSDEEFYQLYAVERKEWF